MAGAQRGEVVLWLRAVTKRFGPLLANDAVELRLRAGETLALLGENGAGKTTLMNILFGHYVADSGEVLVGDRMGRLRPLPPGSPRAALAAGVGMVHQHFTLADNLTARENIVLGTEPLLRVRLGRTAAARRLADLARDSGLTVELDVPVRRLSVGERQRVEILKALYRDARILILDEPTAVLTPAETTALFAILRRLAAAGLGIIFISHKLAEVTALADRVAVMRDGRVVADLAVPGATREQLAGLMVGRTVRAPVRRALPAGDPVLVLERVSVVGEDSRVRLDRADLIVRSREIVGIAGVSGSGQRSLSDLVAGLATAQSGRLLLFGRTAPAGVNARIASGLGRIPEDRHHDGMVGDMTIWENLILERYATPRFQESGLLRRRAARNHARAVIEAFAVRCRGPEAVVRLLSGGNIQKLILGRALDRRPRLILANQPTRGLDIGAVSYVHQKLLEARADGAGVLLISEDLDELLEIADQIAVIHAGRLTETRPTDAWTVEQIGLAMAGHQGSAHAA